MKNVSNKFSLIELMIVIAVIAILMAIAFPVYNGIQERAKKTKAKAEMNAIETAVKSYEMTYGVLPLPNGTATAGSSGLVDTSNTEYPDLMTFLTNVPAPSAGVTGNGRGIRFLDVPKDYASNGFQDPWNQDYTIYVDTNYNGQIADPEGGATPLYGSVFIYTDSGNGLVYSWK